MLVCPRYNNSNSLPAHKNINDCLQKEKKNLNWGLKISSPSNNYIYF